MMRISDAIVSKQILHWTDMAIITAALREFCRVTALNLSQNSHRNVLTLTAENRTK